MPLYAVLAATRPLLQTPNKKRQRVFACVCVCERETELEYADLVGGAEFRMDMAATDAIAFLPPSPPPRRRTIILSCKQVHSRRVYPMYPWTGPTIAEKGNSQKQQKKSVEKIKP